MQADAITGAASRERVRGFDLARGLAVVFMIGGADGLAASLRDKADLRLSFGKATWPHLLARAMLAEQLFRATSLLANHPYHREG